MARLQFTNDIEVIVDNTILSGESQILLDYKNGECGDPAFWLSTNWVKFEDGWYIQITYHYCDTGNPCTRFVISETKLTNNEYEQYRNNIKENGFARIEDVLKSDEKRNN